MNSVVYPVTGGMEDWAYSGSWEGTPIITEPCKPNTYSSYDENKTLYSKNYKNALKSIMFLLEISHSKMPDVNMLGKKNYDCLANLRPNAFNIFNEQHIKIKEKNQCNGDDGYVPRVIRLSLTLIDLLNPYIKVYVKTLNDNEKKVKEINWVVGGAMGVDSTFVLYTYSEKKPDSTLMSDMKKTITEGTGTFDKLKKLLPLQSDNMKGKGIWDMNFTENDMFKFPVNATENVQKNKKIITFVIVSRVDKDWLQQNNPSPNIKPQTHIVNLRNEENYEVTNGNFVLKGRKYFYSELVVIDLTK
jgi:hypothetical protein